jgi:hypothetical protein
MMTQKMSGLSPQIVPKQLSALLSRFERWWLLASRSRPTRHER